VVSALVVGDELPGKKAEEVSWFQTPATGVEKVRT
jgi:hypothetical protein